MYSTQPVFGVCRTSMYFYHSLFLVYVGLLCILHSLFLVSVGHLCILNSLFLVSVGHLCNYTQSVFGVYKDIYVFYTALFLAVCKIPMYSHTALFLVSVRHLCILHSLFLVSVGHLCILLYSLVFGVCRISMYFSTWPVFSVCKTPMYFYTACFWCL